jgi:hypothetical protein
MADAAMTSTMARVLLPAWRPLPVDDVYSAVPVVVSVLLRPLLRFVVGLPLALFRGLWRSGRVLD